MTVDISSEAFDWKAAWYALDEEHRAQAERIKELEDDLVGMRAEGKRMRREVGIARNDALREAAALVQRMGDQGKGHPYMAPKRILALIEVAEGQRCDAMTPQEAAKVLWDMLQLSDGIPKIDQDAAQALWDRVQGAGGFYPVKEFLAELAGIDTGEDSHE
ncbi:hypothetical protein T8A63_07050 [Sulfitobacter sp. OXR-159]|uniref:hypothetical protein n=1 Tax=Sulfitobacter sp. OXR-159 TaxID=3100174 RepID=UPI002AC96F45|nr:hypothetical protein [Sulfitobacter sp. OXR-159]WPZ30712.1 hypothetical protein T8A63_06540 [Sulfitobacter sp. OXR-159]WPZ30813.1 hypothetical protein T8A63_07050 [Sulfitobacter sp. OXR-159]